jgi:hypothetical protein
VATERGPVPKRSSQRRRRNKPEDGEITTGPSGPSGPSGASNVDVPEPDETWHPVARRWYDSLAESGQCRWYEPSDWATAYLLAESMSRDLNPQVVGTTQQGEILRDRIPLKGTSLGSYLKAFSSLLVTEGDRRRARMELERAGSSDDDEDAAVAQLEKYRKRLG